MTVRSVRAGIPWWLRGTRFASLSPPPTLATGAQAVSSSVVDGRAVPWAIEWSLVGSFGHPIDRRLGGLRRHLLGVWLRCATGVGKVGWAHSRRRDGPLCWGCNMCSSSAACSSLQVGSLLVASSASLAVGSEARWAAVRCALASAVSDSQCCGWLSRRALGASLSSRIVRVP
jgi:hypothetical protein